MFHVINVCALTKDFWQFPQGDMTMVNDRSVSLFKERELILREWFINKRMFICSTSPWAPWILVLLGISMKSASSNISTARRGLSHQLQFLKRADHIVILDWMSNIRIFLISYFYEIKKFLIFNFDFLICFKSNLEK